MNPVTTPVNKGLSGIVCLLCELMIRDNTVYQEYLDQINLLIVDAVKKINDEFHSVSRTVEDHQSVLSSKPDATNLLQLLHQALDISQTLHNKINAIMCAIQIEDIAGQVIQEVVKRIVENKGLFESVISNVVEIDCVGESEQAAMLAKIQEELVFAINKKKRSHVNQTDLNVGSAELF